MAAATAAQVTIQNEVRATTGFARGDAHVAAEAETATVTLMAEFSGRRSMVATNRLDEIGLRQLVADAASSAGEHRTPGPIELLGSRTYREPPQIYFPAAEAALSTDAQAELFRRATDATEAARLVGAGDLRVSLRARAAFDTKGLEAYERTSYGELSLTARTKDGKGSGWAWGGYEDWARVKVDDVIARAVDLGRRSAKPVAVEPGRYMVILEPAAVAALVEPVLHQWSARAADRGGTVFSREDLRGANKIGLQMLDRRLGMVSDPWDPDRPAGTAHAADWLPLPGPVTWFERGVLTNLEYTPAYARELARDPVLDPGGVRLTAEGQTTSLEEMIASTRRGIWVNRLSNVTAMNRRTLLLTGTTRDGTFLIENGKITKAIKNLRFTDSPFFALNRLEAWGTPVRASRSVVAPRLKLGDFDFTSVTDAI